MRRRHSETESPAAAVNLTPLLDMVFILLIFFIVTSSFDREAGVQVNRPGAESATQREPGAISISIDDAGNADREARTGVLVGIVDQVRLAGVHNVSVAAEPRRGEFPKWETVEH